MVSPRIRMLLFIILLSALIISIAFNILTYYNYMNYKEEIKLNYRFYAGRLLYKSSGMMWNLFGVIETANDTGRIKYYRDRLLDLTHEISSDTLLASFLLENSGLHKLSRVLGNLSWTIFSIYNDALRGDNSTRRIISKLSKNEQIIIGIKEDLDELSRILINNPSNIEEISKISDHLSQLTIQLQNELSK